MQDRSTIEKSLNALFDAERTVRRLHDELADKPEGALLDVLTDAIAGALARLPGVTLTNQTGSSGQLDLRLRGFTVSPIVGVPRLT